MFSYNVGYAANVPLFLVGLASFPNKVSISAGSLP